MKEAVDRTFEALFALEDLRQIWRDTAPLHKLDAQQQATARALARQVKGCADAILRKVDNGNSE